jgi:hypothetical protein
MFYCFWDLLFVLYFNRVVAYERKGTLPHHYITPLPFKLCSNRYRREMGRADVESGLGGSRVFSTQHCPGSSCAVHLVRVLIIASGIFYVNIGLHSKPNNTSPVTINLTFRDNHIDFECE